VRLFAAQRAASFALWVPSSVPDSLLLDKVWVWTWANGDARAGPVGLHGAGGDLRGYRRSGGGFGGHGAHGNADGHPHTRAHRCRCPLPTRPGGRAVVP